MEDFTSIWTFQESIEDLKQKVVYMRYELELSKKKANEEMRKKEEETNRLVQLLQAAYFERDESKAQLEKLQQFMTFINSTKDNKNEPYLDHIIPFSPDTPLFANSSFTESQSHVSSSDVDSLIYPSHDSRNGMNGPRPKVEMSGPSVRVVEGLGRDRPLPEKGKLLEAVMEAGPLLETLMVAGPLPRWRNPPGVLPSRHIPPVDIKGCASVASKHWNAGHMMSGTVSSASNSSMDDRFINSVCFDSQIFKRQRIQ